MIGATRLLAEMRGRGGGSETVLLMQTRSSFVAKDLVTATS